MKLIINGVEKLEAEFMIEEDFFTVSKDVTGEDERNSFLDLSIAEDPVRLNDGATVRNLKRLKSYIDKWPFDISIAIIKKKVVYKWNI